MKPMACGRNNVDQSQTGRSLNTLASLPPGKVPLNRGKPCSTCDTTQPDCTSHSSLRMARGTPRIRSGSVPVPKADHHIPVEDPVTPKATKPRKINNNNSGNQQTTFQFGRPVALGAVTSAMALRDLAKCLPLTRRAVDVLMGWPCPPCAGAGPCNYPEAPAQG